ncbi:response regulator transcription factor [Pseudomonas lopnurensis]|uniref:response regulator transcription factor n=1 Tax=Pseudomonas lopnurensis TaxID=1477517 RepID=UPI00187AF94E|nr:response regulator [Pseudomonas lopnurensis]MBE7373903.1 response regulator transcription factor [Pseudomonas lopnurensis]
MTTPSTDSHNSVTIHVIDDDRGIREALRRLLYRAGYESRSHSSGAAFLKSYDGAPGCVILDLAMPQMRGEALLEEIARRRLNVVALVLTGHATIESAIRVTRAGALDLLEKPFDNDQLLSALGNALCKAQPIFARQALVNDYQQRHASLTPSERNVMDLILAGLTSQDIAARLGNSKKTIDIHRARVMRKMGAGSTAELIIDWTTLGK